MNASTNANQIHDITTSTLRATAGALLAIAFAATGFSFATTAHADGGSTTSQATATQLQSLIPAPANTQRTDGPTSVPNNGIRMHFLVNGSPTAVLDAYKTELEGRGWTVTVVNSGGWEGAGGATYTGTRGDSYGVFSGGGARSNTDVSACAWPSKPANSSCGDQ
jgi:hypothetical protein